MGLQHSPSVLTRLLQCSWRMDWKGTGDGVPGSRQRVLAEAEKITEARET